MDPVVTPATLSAAGKVIAQQSIAVGKARMRAKSSPEERKAAYLRFQDAALATMSTMLMISAQHSSGVTPLADHWNQRLEENGSTLGQALRGLYLVASQLVVDASEAIAVALGKLRPLEGPDGIDDANTGLEAALNHFTRAVRIDLRYDLPYRKHWWQFRHPRPAATPTSAQSPRRGIMRRRA